MAATRGLVAFLFELVPSNWRNSPHRDLLKMYQRGISQEGQIKIEDYVLEDVESFCYLGNIIDKEGKTAAEVKARIAKAQAALHLINCAEQS
ncbi:hypothetical protein RRG08_023659 [Elysia crispata]|uniref:Uncharacterized protein n=1 Tax=Elysia crispata TaxID=231223 RepID=A0AAE1CLL8_9GAST|nr:hypothetical protein RRG08_023659 [Elysia crispata]